MVKPVPEPATRAFVEATANPRYLFGLGPIEGRKMVNKAQSPEVLPSGWQRRAEFFAEVGYAPRPRPLADHRQRLAGSGGNHAGNAGASSRNLVVSATLHCLPGCAGELLGMAIGTIADLHNAATIALSVVLAFGYAMAVRRILRPRRTLRTAIRIALIADTLSIAVVVLVDNAVLVVRGTDNSPRWNDVRPQGRARA
jgi:Domain of unknown function (DUF4396)